MALHLEIKSTLKREEKGGARRPSYLIVNEKKRASMLNVGRGEDRKRGTRQDRWATDSMTPEGGGEIEKLDF